MFDSSILSLILSKISCSVPHQSPKLLPLTCVADSIPATITKSNPLILSVVVALLHYYDTQEDTLFEIQHMVASHPASFARVMIAKKILKLPSEIRGRYTLPIVTHNSNLSLYVPYPASSPQPQAINALCSLNVANGPSCSYVLLLQEVVVCQQYGIVNTIIPSNMLLFEDMQRQDSRDDIIALTYLFLRVTTICINISIVLCSNNSCVWADSNDNHPYS